ncbi:MAG TPA: amidohydrolase family protein [Ilumatobacter sp.]|nr:amidohydrolase family protein [Ilumatobacter sp.]
MLKLRTTGPFAGLKLIDADSHYTEPLDLWTSRAPAKYQDRVPQVRIADNGRPHWFIDGRQGPKDSGVSFVDTKGRKVAYYDADMLGGAARGDVHPASYDAKARVEMLDEMGIYAQIVYPNVLGFATPTLIQNLDRDYSVEIVKIYNDAMAEWQAEGPGRLYPQAVLPFWDIPASVLEAQRVKELGLTGVTMAGEPHLGGLPDLGQPDWNPLYEALEDLELPIDIHIGARNVEVAADGPGASWPSLPERAGKPVRSVQIELANARFLANIVASDILIRYPKLRWVSVESGIGWIPFVLERVDYEYREEFEGMGPPELPPAKEMFQRGVYGTFWFEDAGPTVLIDRIGEDNILWETDFPHPTSLYPSPVERSEEKLKDLEPRVVRKIMQDNAAKLYKIPV